AQTIELTSAAPAGTLTFIASPSAQSGGNWLGVQPTSGTIPATLTVSAAAGALAPGTYQGAINLTVPGAVNSTINVPVTFTVGTALNLSATSLTFNFQAGGAAPANQNVQVTSGDTPIPFSTSASSTGNWLTVSPAGGNTPAALTVSVNPAGLAPGNYTGTITVTSPLAASGPQTIGVQLNVTAPAAPVISQITNGASNQPTPAIPGLVVVIYGSNMGPTTLSGLRRDAQGNVTSELAGTRVLFDNIPAPLIYLRNDQLGAIVPYGLFGRVTTQVRVERFGVRSNEVTLRVEESSPAIFTLDFSGRGQGAILNQNNTVNGANNAAPKGSIVQVFATGEGQTNPPSNDGQVSNELRRPRLPVRVRVGGQEVTATYAGSAPGLVAGVFQVNVPIPETVGPGNVSIEIQVGNASSPVGVTVAVQ
ncbi:MAG: hypothetical protein HYZ57_15170, partial [Acidobacteria bacterium]|nr:hypothetical protein [Acidobacteriota bacterium]